MALKDDILKAFETNLTHDKVNQEGEIKTIKPPIGRGTPLDTLAIDLSTAIATYIDRVKFRIEDLKAEGVILPGGIQVATAGTPAAQSGASTNLTKLIVQTSKTKNEVGLPQTSANANVLLVKVDKHSNKSLSGVDIA